MIGYNFYLIGIICLFFIKMKFIILIEYDFFNGIVRVKVIRWYYFNLCFVFLNLLVLINFTVIDDILGEVEIV